MIELNDETRWILGRPNFACAGIAEKLRQQGKKIERKAECEQAAVIHWMLEIYELYGNSWREHAERLLNTPKL